jgi:hypothetical protein
MCIKVLFLVLKQTRSRPSHAVPGQQYSTAIASQQMSDNDETDVKLNMNVMRLETDRGPVAFPLDT